MQKVVFVYAHSKAYQRLDLDLSAVNADLQAGWTVASVTPIGFAASVAGSGNPGTTVAHGGVVVVLDSPSALTREKKSKKAKQKRG